MHRDPVRRLSSPDSHQKSLERQVRRHAGLGGPTNDAAREQIDDDTQVQPALVGLDVSDVGDPDLIGRGCLELLFQPVLGHDRGLAAVAAGAASVADLPQRSRPTTLAGQTRFSEMHSPWSRRSSVNLR